MHSCHVCFFVCALGAIAALYTEACPPLAIPVAAVIGVRHHRKKLAEKHEIKDRANHFKGCFIDVEADRDMGELKLREEDMKIDTCVNKCKGDGSKFIGLQNATDCYCSNSYGEHGETSNTKCSMKCPGNTNETCGGDYVNSVYEIK